MPRPRCGRRISVLVFREQLQPEAARRSRRARSLLSLGSTFARYPYGPESRCASGHREDSASVLGQSVIAEAEPSRTPPGWVELGLQSMTHGLISDAGHPAPADDSEAGIPRTGTARRSSGRRRKPNPAARSIRGSPRRPSRIPDDHNHRGFLRLQLETVAGRSWQGEGWLGDESRVKATRGGDVRQVLQWSPSNSPDPEAPCD